MAGNELNPNSVTFGDDDLDWKIEAPTLKRLTWLLIKKTESKSICHEYRSFDDLCKHLLKTLEVAEMYDQNTKVLLGLIPSQYVVRIREENGEENLFQSLIVSLIKMIDKLSKS